MKLVFAHLFYGPTVLDVTENFRYHHPDLIELGGRRMAGLLDEILTAVQEEAGGHRTVRQDAQITITPDEAGKPMVIGSGNGWCMCWRSSPRP